MLFRSLLVRSGPLRLSPTLTTRISSRSLSVLRLAQPVRCAVPSYANSRQFSAAPAFHTENRDDIRTPRPPSGSCFVANLPYKITAKELQEAFSNFGKVESVKLVTSEAGLPRGFGYVHFESVEDAISFVEAHEADPIFVLDRQLHVQHAQRARNAPKPAEPCDTLMVRDFRGDSEADVRAMFGSFADDVQAVRFNRKDVGQPSRNAFIQFPSVSMATEAMDAFKGRNEDIRVTYARQRQAPANPYSLVSRLSGNREH